MSFDLEVSKRRGRSSLRPCELINCPDYINVGQSLLLFVLTTVSNILCHPPSSLHSSSLLRGRLGSVKAKRPIDCLRGIVKETSGSLKYLQQWANMLLLSLVNVLMNSPRSNGSPEVQLVSQNKDKFACLILSAS